MGISSLVLDLSANGGGYLNRAVELADEFLPEGKKIVYTRGRITVPEDYYSTSNGGWEKGNWSFFWMRHLPRQVKLFPVRFRIGIAHC